MESDLIVAAVTALVAIIGGGGMWLGILQNKVTNNTRDIEKLVKAMNGHIINFNSVVTKVAKIETTCDNILNKLNQQTYVSKRIIEDGPEG